jgi:hypothetical protein
LAGVPGRRRHRPLEEALADRVRSLQVLRMLEMLAGQDGPSSQIRSVVADRLLALLQ